ncbi:hypothetical protein EXB91_26835 [Salmonella enterica subsp. enterica serovar Florida]|uniref:Uncharacterized protein n=3 Tax=Salmonella enterica I TaxID=59201 RepID=A0A5U8JIV9_SALET|nr:hypothetical protein [Salmonella enterica]EBR7996924.1 hypothetical protein [Salmonella enterica subsp. enterica serovar Panama]EBS4089025.1 hypothetical protein [Salmonella enterica subsp. enterica serovar Newport]ECG3787210.1 hypothetical protein [Salmonella enterica subsp. enterica serovar Florida]ASD87235.1 hypothetical protein LFZ16_13910 [Salmonella enterica subsp. enterica serovar India str. SA20085604]EBR8436501.1 hypothetical protein [Salmonella enterica subsp. enterica serovar Pan
MTEEEKIKIVFPIAARLTAEYSQSPEYKEKKKTKSALVISPESYFKGEYSLYMKLLNEKLKSLDKNQKDQS